MTEEKTVVSPATETKETETKQTNEVSGGGNTAENVVKQEAVVDPRDAELERLRLLDKHQKEVIEHKNRAIETMKKKTSDGDNNDTQTNNFDPSMIDEAVAKAIEPFLAETENLKSLINKSKVDDLISRFSTDPKEQELIRLNYQMSVKKTDDVSKDIENAYILANRHRLIEQGKQEGLNARKEEVMAGFSGSRVSSGSGKNNDKSLPAEYENILTALGVSQEAKKYL